MPLGIGGGTDGAGADGGAGERGVGEGVGDGAGDAAQAGEGEGELVGGVDLHGLGRALLGDVAGGADGSGVGVGGQAGEGAGAVGVGLQRLVDGLIGAGQGHRGLGEREIGVAAAHLYGDGGDRGSERHVHGGGLRGDHGGGLGGAGIAGGGDAQRVGAGEQAGQGILPLGVGGGLLRGGVDDRAGDGLAGGVGDGASDTAQTLQRDGRVIQRERAIGDDGHRRQHPIY